MLTVLPLLEYTSSGSLSEIPISFSSPRINRTSPPEISKLVDEAAFWSNWDREEPQLKLTYENMPKTKTAAMDEI